MDKFICEQCGQEKTSYPRGRTETGWVCNDCSKKAHWDKISEKYNNILDISKNYYLDTGDTNIMDILENICVILENRSDIYNFDDKLETINKSMTYTFNEILF